MAVNEVVASFDEAVKDIFDGATILIGGSGTPGGSPRKIQKLTEPNLIVSPDLKEVEIM